MTRSVDLNADMGEGYGAWDIGDDAALLKIVTSANIACGMHAGDWNVMARTMAAAVQNGVGIGAHPGFPDLHGFGRNRMNLPLPSLQNLVRYQVGAAQAMARAAGGAVRHLKLHGALANMTSEDEAMARACYEAALSVAPDIIIMVLAGTAQQRAATDLGCGMACEIFADRAYNDDATLVDRSLPGAVIHDPDVAGPRIAEMVREGAIITASGKRIETRIDTICLHGDTPTAVKIAGEVRRALEGNGVTLAQFSGAPGGYAPYSA
ncbi:LamB/YcsF family protein [Roseovarius sp. ZX-A-9]|uniref:LamB/YcsF family protein n=1 Tax=Roseovarius sp. ZX-A-9 TaxID=3014783 RepID=UPI00232F15F0|nr:5-oxoprolinase subunit PxpA [Roseovarius sp. ZX-A-9]MDX1785238.1 5-oxoprolinase subunit PxpA [Roseovarius sp.]